jgi:hypothetical protein
MQNVLLPVPFLVWVLAKTKMSIATEYRKHIVDAGLHRSCVVYQNASYLFVLYPANWFSLHHLSPSVYTLHPPFVEEHHALFEH